MAGGKANWRSHLGRQFANSKAKIILLCNLAIMLPSIYSNELRTNVHTHTHTHLHMNIDSSIIHNSQKVEATQMSLN